METLKFIVKSQKMITELSSAIVNNKINVLGSVYDVVLVGIHFIKVVGSRGAKYTISTSPKCVVIENKECNVYFISDKRGVSVDFTFFDGNTSVLHSA